MKEPKVICAWCGRPNPCGPLVRTDGKVGEIGAAETLPCCSDQCRDKAARYFRFERWGVPVFLLLILVAAALLLAPELGLGDNDWFPMAGMVLLGAAVIAFPFPVSGMVERWGVRRAIWICRGLGILTLAASLLLWP